MSTFPFYSQSENKDCGPTCLKMVCKFYGKEYSISHLKQLCNLSDEGTSLYSLQQAAIKLGFDSYGVQVSFDELFDGIELPCIIHWNKRHYVVLLPGSTKNKIVIADPVDNIQPISKSNFMRLWTGEADGETGYVLVMKPTRGKADNKFDWQGLLHYVSYFKPHKKQFGLLLFLFFITGLISYITPHITKNVIDKGINGKDVSIVALLLLGQFGLALGAVLIEMTRGWFMLRINNTFSIAILYNFLSKVLRLPMSYFDNKRIGDIQQRMYDHSRIQTFIVSNSTTLIVSTITFIALFASLASFSSKILLILLLFGGIKVLWVKYFLVKRKELDYANFYTQSNNQDMLFEILSGAQDIKLYGCEQEKMDGWNKAQKSIFNINITSFKLNQKQGIGASLLNNFESILITFISANDVINGHMTLGMMMSINIISGQLKGSIMQYTSLIKSYQDAKISLDRLAEIQQKKDEDDEEEIDKELDHINIESIRFENVSFSYENASKPALKDVSFSVKKGETLAVVGVSGSGKSTLMKLFLKFYKPTEGRVWINNHINLQHVSSSSWRSKCGVVMQEGHIFSGSIRENISVTENVDEQLLYSAARQANIRTWIESLPLKWDTQIGRKGTPTSTGQKQRILIARALYRNPQVLFFDEATSSLDTENESIIARNIAEKYADCIKVVIAHRFSTIRDASKILVVDDGRIVEAGSHEQLMNDRGKYYQLISAQLNLNENEEERFYA